VKPAGLDASAGVVTTSESGRASRVRFRFGQVKMNHHISFEVRRLVWLVAAMTRASEEKRRQVAALQISRASFVRLLRASFGKN
jgi:hypothetical protein